MAVSSTGTASGQTVGGTTVNISGIATNFRGASVAAGVRFLVVSTGAGQNYTYHKATLKEDDLVGLSGDINDFAERYRVGSSNPTTNNDAGDLFFNTSTGKLMVYNGTSSAWEEAQSVGNFFISTLSPAFDGTTTDFTITNAPTNAQQILLIIEGVIQKPNSGTSTPTEGFALNSSTVKLAAAPATGASYHAVVMGSTVNIGTPSDNTVTTAILQNNSVSSSKIQADAIDGSKIADDSINSEHYVDGSIDTAHIADEAITLAKLEHGTSSNNGKFLRANNGADPSYETIDLTALSASNLTSGTVPDARFPATLPAASGANLTNLPAGNLTGTVADARISTLTASKLTGALPAIDGSALTGVSSQKADGCVTENSQTISNNYTMTSGKSGISAGPITIANNVTVNIPSGSRYVIV